MNSPATTLLSQRLMTSKTRFLRDGAAAAGVYLPAAFLSAVERSVAPPSASNCEYWQEILGRSLQRS
jgi:hypothetical protein